MLPETLLPGVVLQTVELEILNDNLFSKIWFNYNEHSRIDEASLPSNKREVFLHTLRCCDEGVIEVFQELCSENNISCVTRGKLFLSYIICKMCACTFLNAYFYHLNWKLYLVCVYVDTKYNNYNLKLTQNYLMLQATNLWHSRDSNLLKEVI